MIKNRNYKFLSSVMVILATVFVTSLLLILPDISFVDNDAFYRASTAALAAYILIILYAWVIIHPVLGLLSLIFSTLVTIFYSLLTLQFSFSFHILGYGAISAVSHYYLTDIDEFIRLNNLKLEDYQENINSLRNGFQKDEINEATLEKKKLRYAALKTFTEQLSSTLEVDEVLEIIVEEAESIIGKSDETMLYMVSRTETELNLVCSRRADTLKVIRAKKGDLFDNWVLRHRQPLLVDDVRKDFRFDIEKEKDTGDIHSIIISPMVHEQRTLGILRLASVQCDNYSPDDLRLLNIISDLAAVSIENTIAYQRTVELAITDSLTSLLVLRNFNERLEEEFNRALRASAEISLIILDVDFFKAYNDSFGHSAGDIALKAIAKIIRRITKPGDLLGRYGGEEFIIALPGIPRKEAGKIAERIRRDVAEHDFSIRRYQASLTISAGVSSFPRDAKIRSDLIQKADEALYQAKRKGRNKVCLAS